MASFLYPVGSSSSSWNDGVNDYAAWLGTYGSSSSEGCWTVSQFKNTESYAIKITSAYYHVTSRSGSSADSSEVRFLISDNANDLDHYITQNFTLSEETNINTGTVEIVGSPGSGTTINNPQYAGKDILIDANASFYVGFWQPAKSSIVTMRVKTSLITSNNFKVNANRPSTSVPVWSDMVQWNSSSGPNSGASDHVPRFRVAYEPALSDIKITDGSSQISAISIEDSKSFDLDCTVTGSAETISWSSSNSSIASVNTNGTVTANGYGTATITVTAKSGDTIKTDSCKVYVYTFSPEASKTSVDTISGSNTSTISSNFKHPGIDISLSWGSADSNTLKITGTGNASRTATGIKVEAPATSKSVSVTVSVPNNSTYGLRANSKNIGITVKQSVTSFTLSSSGGAIGDESSGFTIYTGAKNNRNVLTLNVLNIQPANAYNKTVSFQKISGGFSLQSSENSTTATANGSIPNENGEQTGEILCLVGLFKKNITVNTRQSVTSISYKTSTNVLWTLSYENTAVLTTEILPNNAYHKTFSWSFLPTELLTTEDFNAATQTTKLKVVVQQLPEIFESGNVDVTVSLISDDDSSINQIYSSEVSVRQYAAGIRINENPAPTQFLYDKPITSIFTATVLPKNSYYKNVDVIWSTSDKTLATILKRESDGAGILTSIYAGDDGLGSIVLNVKAPKSKSSYVSDSVSVDIRQKALSITLTPSEISLDAINTVDVTCVYQPNNTSNKATKWSSENNNVIAPQNTTQVICKYSTNEFGDTKIFAETTDGTNLKAETNVLVTVPGKVAIGASPRKIKKIFYFDGNKVIRGKKLFSFNQDKIKRVQSTKQ